MTFLALVVAPLWLVGAWYTAVSRTEAVYDGWLYKLGFVLICFGGWPGVLNDIEEAP